MQEPAFSAYMKISQARWWENGGVMAAERIIRRKCISLLLAARLINHRTQQEARSHLVRAFHGSLMGLYKGNMGIVKLLMPGY